MENQHQQQHTIPQLYTSLHVPAVTSKKIPIFLDNCSFRTNQNYSHDDTTNSSANMDSGYTSSNFNLTPNQTPNVSQLRHTTVNHDLATIAECDEQPTKVTPTTQTQLKLLSFHLTTPKVDDQPGPSMQPPNIFQPFCFAETTNSSDNFDNISLTPPKLQADQYLQDLSTDIDEPKTPARSISSMENSQNANSTPRKPKMGTKRKRCAFREKLYSDPVQESKKSCLDFDVENAENQHSLSFDVAQLEFSPISKGKSAAKVLRDRINTNLDTTMTSSTPKHDVFRANFYVEKAASMHKSVFPLKSGSPKKRTKLFRKFQSFSPGKLRQAQQQQNAALVHRRFLFVDRVNPPSATQVSAESVVPKKQLVRQMAFVKEEDEDDEDIKYYDPQVRHCAQLMTRNESLNIELPEKMNVSCEADNVLAKPLVDDVNESIFEPEKRKMLYPQLPRTPPRVETPSKRYSLQLSTKKGTPGRDTFYLGKTKTRIIRQTYDGIERFNILSRLFKNNQLYTISTILKYLDDEDLERAYNVSHKWREMLNDDELANRRRIKFMTAKIPLKENLMRKSFSLKSFTKEGSVTEERHPFSVLNKDVSECVSVELPDYSPPASPSKRKFKENQKVIRKLGARTKVTTCPRCSKPSPITESISKLLKFKSRLRKTQSVTVHNRSAQMEKKRKFDYYHTLSGESQQSGNSEEDETHNCKGDSSDMSGGRNLRRNLFGAEPAEREYVKLLKSNSCDTQAVFLASLPPQKQVSLDDSLYTTMSPQETTESPKKRTRKSIRRAVSPWSMKFAKATPKYDYAICSGKNCRFKFCVRCMCPYHPGEVCTSELQPYSPSKEEEKRQQHQNVAGTKQSRQALKRLVKLGG